MTSQIQPGQLEAVNAIRLLGAPQTLLIDAGALLSSDGEIPSSLAAKLQVLAQHGGMRVVVLLPGVHATPEAVRRMPHLHVASSLQEIQLDGPALAILTECIAVPPQVYGWYVGGGSAPAPLRPARHVGVRAMDEILALLGTAEVQERAGLAFRAAGAGKEIPREAPFDPKNLDGITAAVTNHPERVEHIERRYHSHDELDLDRDTDRLIMAALPPILASQDRSGAIAAAPPPRNPDEPNYWFFWQRDAGQAVLSMARLRNTSAGSQARESARAFVDRYIDFVEQLPRHDGVDISDLGVSRFTMSGRPITSYGNPQKDGPAHTAFAVLAALGESARSYAVSKPYLEYLSRHIFGPSFDPWEFAFGDVVFDYNLARRALRKGAELAQIHGDDVAASRYRARAGELQTALEAFKSAKAGSVLSVLIFTVAVYGIHRLWLRLPLDRQ